MEQTLGKRIAQYRKNKGLTQEKLAEALGVTAQAVSKWENDLSCPDINILPRLAEIFGITTDELLGRESQKVHNAQIVDEPQAEQEDPGIHIQKGNWEFQYEAGKKGAVFFALYVLLLGGFMLLKALLNWDSISIWSFAWPSALVLLGISGLCRKFSFFSLGLSLFSTYFLLNNLQIIHWNVGTVFLPVVIIIFGLSLLADALRKPKHKRFNIHHTSPKNEKFRSDCAAKDEQFECSAAFGDCRHNICLDRLSRGEIECCFGNLIVDLQGCDTLSEDCHVEADCAFGNLEILVPSRYQVVSQNDTAFGNVQIEGTPDAEPAGKIHLECDVSFGQIFIQYI